MIRNLKSGICNNDKRLGDGDEKYYEIEYDIGSREFPNFKFTIDLSECLAELLYDKLPYQIVYYEDYRL